jgi:hypothetical protein
VWLFFLFFIFCPFWESNEANAKVKGKKRSPLAGQVKETGARMTLELTTRR